ncbi:MAG: BREX-1 system phosphatase PglZ type A [Bdellovibrionales bacterium CG10_big_fil_rev_8_21_14_0_10_45_34]|nr:MAG: BREX-1 system phosphatase PglZ type A [Bdellovibrionales bacterium CG10_big_fil_rev_8_21_14_0_10_45_34]
MSKIKQALDKLFQTHRVVFWYDTKNELKQDFESLSLVDVEKIEIQNNEFFIKHKVLREKNDSKFLLYHQGARPKDSVNWLIDMELAFGEFRSDQNSIWLGEIGLGFDYADFVQEHITFFKNQTFREKLKERLLGFNNKEELRLKLFAICLETEDRIDAVIEEFLAELANGSQMKYQLLKDCNLESHLWKSLEKSFGYISASPSVKDFALELFKSSYQMNIEKRSKLNSDAYVFMRRWKDSRNRFKDFERLSDQFEDLLSIKQDLENRSYRELQDCDYFQLVDKKILSLLVNDLANKTISPSDCISFIRNRKSTHWYKDNIEKIYEAINHAAQFFKLLAEANLTIANFTDGFKKYTDNWYKIDLNYRKFIYFTRESGQSSLLRPLIDQIENQYTNNFLGKLNNEWQPHIDNLERWEFSGVPTQRSFFNRTVSPILDKNNKVFVIISDALRFEVGKELYNKILQEDRYEGDVNFIQSTIPSYTQLGMAALLPHSELSLSSDKVEIVFADGKPTSGSENRRKIISDFKKHKGTAVLSSDFLSMHLDETKSLVKEHSFAFIYHDEIDSAGKNPDQVPGAVERTFETIIKIIKKLTSSNANRILITADHGFLFQDKDLDESDFLADSSIKGEILQTDRRFFIGKGLEAINNSFKIFDSKQAGISGDVSFAIPKTVNRIRKKGSSIRFVHGGATLQEIVVPVLDIRKKRESDIGFVSIEVLGSTSNLITTGQLSVALYQSEPVTNKVRPLKIKAGLYCDETLISDSKELLFDMTSANPRDRELKVQFVLTQEANRFNNKEVELRLEEEVKDTTKYRIHRIYKYTLRRSFTSDFDF